MLMPNGFSGDSNSACMVFYLLSTMAGISKDKLTLILTIHLELKDTCLILAARTSGNLNTHPDHCPLAYVTQRVSSLHWLLFAIHQYESWHD